MEDDLDTEEDTDEEEILRLRGRSEGLRETIYNESSDQDCSVHLRKFDCCCVTSSAAVFSTKMGSMLMTGMESI